MIPEARPKEDPFSRNFPVAFQDFHPKLNQVLQRYAQENPGNSFQIVRLGNDGITLRGFYREPQSRVRFPLAIVARPVDGNRSRIEVKISPDLPEASWGFLKGFLAQLYEIMEKENSPLH